MKTLTKSRLYDVIHKEVKQQIPDDKERLRINVENLTVAVWTELEKKELV